ncbi:MAG: redoxin domain-containing protein [Actinomycetota bacterium]
MRKAVLFVLVVLAAVLTYELLHHRTHQRIQPVEPSAPDLSLTDLNGAPIRTTGYNGKIVLVNFWAAWCVPCREEIPEFMKLQEEYPDKVQIIGISLDDSESELRNFYKTQRINYPIVLGNLKIADAYGGILGLPTTYIIDQKGHIRGHQVGSTNFSKLELQINGLLR